MTPFWECSNDKLLMLRIGAVCFAIVQGLMLLLDDGAEVSLDAIREDAGLTLVAYVRAFKAREGL